ncbi:MAG: nuclear transport factor 2 family protein [Croceibacterium sp.]
MTSSTDLSAIPLLAQRWMNAWVAADSALLEQFLAPEFALVGAALAGQAFERAIWLQVAVTGYRARWCTFADPLVRPISDSAPRVAAMSAVWTQDAHYGDNDMSGRYYITDLWREGGPLGWQIVLRSSVALDTMAAASRAFAVR